VTYSGLSGQQFTPPAPNKPLLQQQRMTMMMMTQVQQLLPKYPQLLMV
jgi:hypothetical protein